MEFSSVLTIAEMVTYRPLRPHTGCYSLLRGKNIASIKKICASNFRNHYATSVTSRNRYVSTVTISAIVTVIGNLTLSLMSYLSAGCKVYCKCKHMYMQEMTSMVSKNQTAATNDIPDLVSESKPQVIYRCKKCRRIVAAEEYIVSHQRGEGQKCFKWRKRSSDPWETENTPPQCSSIFVEPMKWMEVVQDGCVGDKLQCIGCKARLGSFNWAGMQCNCGAWVNPAFQLHKSRIDECDI